jgi:Fe2+ or Zn2+ uptake regulation protein
MHGHLSPSGSHPESPPESHADMAAVPFYDKIVDTLKANGAKLTRPRKLVAHLLTQATAPMSAYEIHDAIVAAGETIDVVSVYRIIDLLESLKLVSRVPSTHQVFITENSHCCKHPVLICNNCGSAIEVPWHGAKQLMQDIAIAAKVHVEGLSLELNGLCHTCIT